ncbi:hypothetical protein BACCELL_03711 [Bacteroides cellulosilyticus DSM 14838]|uniref:Uncharacterized protein n=1 Tax=Bacteroides cellulosilyticus DSM 14838 TaxID=537012 RepID=E2NHD4_9BACE|nr:hypothetical protein BACCELL_03711 [Bacteroides cellulosilyticus DSM 14838]
MHKVLLLLRAKKLHKNNKKRRGNHFSPFLLIVSLENFFF